MFTNLFSKLLKKDTKQQDCELCQNPHTVTPGNADVILEKLAYNKDIKYLPDAFCMLLTSDLSLKERIAESIFEVLNQLSASRLKAVDQIFRQRTSMDWSHDWYAVMPESLTTPNMPQQQRIAIYGLCSFHPNGYLREKAVRQLSKFSTGSELPYLLMRLNDWVSIVSYAAGQAVRERLNPANAKAIVSSLPLIFGLENCLRYEHTEIIRLATESLRVSEVQYALIDGLAVADSRVRQYCLSLLAHSKSCDIKTMMNLIEKEPDPINRMVAIKIIMDRMTSEEFGWIKDQLLADKYARIRVLGYELCYRFAPAESKMLLTQALTDSHCSIRETARYLLKKHSFIGFADYYIDALNGQSVYGAICGLGETGKDDDTAYLLDFLEDERPRIVTATIKALARLAFPEFKATFVEMLADERPSVSKACKQVLAGKITTKDAQLIHKIFRNIGFEHVKRYASMLLCCMPKWDSLSYVLEISSDCEESVSTIGKYHLNRWLKEFNTCFAKPSAEQIQTIERAVELYRIKINDIKVGWLVDQLRSIK